jgi:hypothetical protein
MLINHAWLQQRAEFYDIWPRSGILYVMAEAKQKMFCMFVLKLENMNM